MGYSSFQAVEQSTIPHAQSPQYPATEGNYVAQRFEWGSSGLFGSELGGDWKSKRGILRQYRMICFLLSEDGILRQTLLRATRLRLLIYRFLRHFTKAEVPGWYDTHARHSRAETGNVLDSQLIRQARRLQLTSIPLDSLKSIKDKVVLIDGGLNAIPLDSLKSKEDKAVLIDGKELAHFMTGHNVGVNSG